MLIEDEVSLKSWIARDVEPISDAEPEALAKYVIALVKKPLAKDDLEDLCNDKLNLFLQANTKAFVQRLFACLKTNQYMHNKTPPKKAEIISEKTEVQTDIEENQLTPGYESDHENREVEKGYGATIRIGYRGDRYYRRRSRSKSRSRSPLRKEKHGDYEDRRPQRSQRCRYFHEKGFCMRGDKCHFDHGPDPLVVDESTLEKIIHGSSNMAAGGKTSVYDIYGNSMDPPPPGVESGQSEGYNPEAPAINVQVSGIDFSIPPPSIPPAITQQQLPIAYGQFSTVPGMVSSYHPVSGIIGGTGQMPIGQVYQVSQPSTTNTALTYTGSLDGPIFRSRGDHFKSNNRPNPMTCSLLVQKIPPEQNKIALLDQHFSKFGEVTNIQVQYEGRSDAAFVTFKSRREAQNAYKSTEPIFNNRFIKVFWPNDQQSQATEAVAPAQSVAGFGEQKDTVTTLPIVSTDATNQQSAPLPPRGAFTKTFMSQPENATEEGIKDGTALVKLLELQKMKTDLYSKLIDQQKDLLKKIQETDNKDVKKKHFKLIKKLDGLTKSAKEELEQLNKRIAHLRKKS